MGGYLKLSYFHGIAVIYLLVVSGFSTVLGENFTVGYLANFKGRTNLVRQGVIISGAITYALDVINNDTTLLKDHYLLLTHNDTNGERLIGTKAVIEQYTNGAIAFFGPEDSCDVEATVAASLNLPMISFKCADSKVSNKELYPTFVRTFPTEDRVVRSVIALLQYYQWYKFSVISENTPQYQTVAFHLLNELKRSKNFTINSKRTFDPHFICCEEHRPCCEGMYNLIDETHKGTRVYVFIGNTQDLVKMLVHMKMKRLLLTGEYVVIYVDLETYSESESYKYFWPRTGGTGGSSFPFSANEMENYFDLASSLLVIVPSPPKGQTYNNFEEQVRLYNEREPFNMNDTFYPFKNYKKHVTIYASYLYDAVMLYAKALNRTLEKGIEPNNGTAIIQEIIHFQRYKSVTGAEMNIDENGDAEGNYTVLALLPLDPNIVLKGIAGNLSKSMVPAGNFHYDPVTKYPVFKMELTVQWVSGKPPLDAPPCGFDGSGCSSPPDKNREIAASVLASLLVVVSLVAAITYRNWKYEQEIAGLLWKIDIRDLKRGVPDGILGYLSKMSVGSRGTMESKGGQQAIFATTAMYKGIWVAVKHVQFNRKTADIPRETKKEMKLMREIHQDNVNPFIGACVQPDGIYLVNEYCGKGCLQFILENDNFKLDNMFIASLVFDLIKGMIFLHDSDLKIHGNLKSSNCLITSRWVLQVADFGLHEIRVNAEPVNPNDEQLYYRARLWAAPELLREQCPYPRGSQKADVYAFGIILHEIMARQGPWGSPDLMAKEIVERVMKLGEGDEPFRPSLVGLECQDFIKQSIRDCWHEKPEVRPDFRHIRERLNKMRHGMKANIMDNMIAMLEKYSHNLEELVEERTAQLEEEKKKTEALLHRMLPQSVAEELMKGEYVKPESFDAVTIYFSDIVGFTEMSASSTPMEVVTFLNDLYTVFDAIIRNYEVYKVETIGDAYMVVSGLPNRNGDLHASEIASMALELLDSIKTFHIRHKPNQTLKLRIGMHTGPVVAGVVGLTMPRYCLFGDTVNTASRMESNGEALKIHVSPQCRDHLEKLGGYALEERGLIKLKGKGEMRTYWLTGKTSAAPPKQRRQTDIAAPQPLFQPLKDGENRSRRSPKLSIAEFPRRSSVAIRHDLHNTLEDSNSTLNGVQQVPPPSFLRVLSDSPRVNRVSPALNRVQHLKENASDFNKDKNSASCGDIPNPNGHNLNPRALYEIKERVPPPILQTPNGRIEGLDDDEVNSSENETDCGGLRFRSDLHRRSKNGFMMTVNQFQPPTLGLTECSKPLLQTDNNGSAAIMGEGATHLNGGNHLKAPLLPLDSKRWRSCDEINSPCKANNNKSLRYLFTGILNKKFLDLNRRGSDASVGSARVRSTFEKNNGESVV